MLLRFPSLLSAYALSSPPPPARVRLCVHDCIFSCSPSACVYARLLSRLPLPPLYLFGCIRPRFLANPCPLLALIGDDECNGGWCSEEGMTPLSQWFSFRCDTLIDRIKRKIYASSFVLPLFYLFARMLSRSPPSACMRACSSALLLTACVRSLLDPLSPCLPHDCVYARILSCSLRFCL